MANEEYTFSQARTRLEDIVTQVRKKDTSLEQSLELLEEGVRLANACTELIDSTELRTVAVDGGSQDAEPDVSDSADGELDGADVTGEDVLVEVVDIVEVVTSEDGDVVAVTETVIAEEVSPSEFAEADDAWTESEPAEEPSGEATEEPSEPDEREPGADSPSDQAGEGS